MEKLRQLLPVVAFEIVFSAILAFILIVTASLSVGTFAFVYQGF